MLKPVVRSLILLLLITAGTFAQSGSWSKPVNGLRARLTALPSERKDLPFCRVFIEFENVANVMGQRSIRFDRERLAFRVVDRKGNPLPPPTTVFYDGMRPDWRPTLLPFAGSIRFQISFPGMGFRPTDKVIVDLGSQSSWIVPQNGTAWYLSATLSIPAQKGDHPSIDWNGTIEIPPAKIPPAR